MYLKGLEIQGFKSFPDKTYLSFEKDITAIVGPNGSGKSNISDAILWVMGEQSSKTLRGSKMEDVIFGGTQTRGKLGFAQVSLVIDNSARYFDDDSPEVVISRRYYRSGESEYCINRKSVRLKDVNTLLMDTGLGRDGYSIIGQGKISDIISTKSSDRREIFDEAAGISKFRYRKEESEQKLARTEDNLLRVNDKIEELELQVEPLEKQAAVAEEYLKLKDELKTVEVTQWVNGIDAVSKQREALSAEYSQLNAAVDDCRKKLESVYSASDVLIEKMHEKDSQIEAVREKLSQKERLLADCRAEIAVIDNNILNCRNNSARLIKDLEDRDVRIKEISKTVSDLKTMIETKSAEGAAAKAKIKQLGNVIDGCKIKLSNREKQLEEHETKQRNLSIDSGTCESKLRMLTEMKQEYEGYSKAVKAVMKQFEKGFLAGIRGPVSRLIKVPEEYTTAIEIALGASGQHIITETRNHAKSAIEYLKRNDAGRATFLPLDTISGNKIQNFRTDDEGYVGLACELISYQEEYSGVMLSLLGRTIISETLNDAVRIAKDCGYKYKVVSLDGQVVNAGGSMTGGSNYTNTGVIARANELEKLTKRLDELKKLIAENSVLLEKAKQSYNGIKYQYETAVGEQNKANTDAAAIDAEIKSYERSVAQFTQILDNMREGVSSVNLAVKDNDKLIEKLLKEKDSKNKDIEAYLEQISETKAEIETISGSKVQLEGKRTQNDRLAHELSEELLKSEKDISRLDIKLGNLETEEKLYIDRLWDTYALTRSTSSEFVDRSVSTAELNRRATRLKNSISALGNPNIGAIEEYKRVKSRFDFLSEQRADISSAKDELVKIINEITAEMKELFLSNFGKIRESFKDTFADLFGGGKADLLLEDEDNVLECGIEIKVQPPGKALTSITLLSGGEMAFVAIALYFAILKVKPAPFCVMDEIEAALDEPNVYRFASYLKTLSDKTQFIVITHRRGTMEQADMLYGVTMQEKGVSAVISLNLEDAKYS